MNKTSIIRYFIFVSLARNWSLTGYWPDGNGQLGIGTWTKDPVASQARLRKVMRKNFGPMWTDHPNRTMVLLELVIIPLFSSLELAVIRITRGQNVWILNGRPLVRDLEMWKLTIWSWNLIRTSRTIFRESRDSFYKDDVKLSWPYVYRTCTV